MAVRRSHVRISIFNRTPRSKRNFMYYHNLNKKRDAHSYYKQLISRPHSDDPYKDV